VINSDVVAKSIEEGILYVSITYSIVRNRQKVTDTLHSHGFFSTMAILVTIFVFVLLLKQITISVDFYGIDKIRDKN
jgi:NhaP-type Na+/H+ or K+/H+ antiporter